MKKIISGICMVMLSAFAMAQNGLENIIVEKYYVSNAADSAGSIGALPVGSVTYRIYVDMLPGYKFQALYGVPGHELRIASTAPFFNNEDRGTTNANGIANSRLPNNTVMLDSWFSVGAASTANFGILKSEDNGVNNIVNANGILHNNDPSAGIPLTTQDGVIAGTPQAVTFVGLTATDLSVFDATSNAGSLFTTSNGSIASLNGSLGPVAATNKVLVAQLTTKGALSFKLNVQIGTPTGSVQNFVAENPTGSEVLMGSLTYPATAMVTIASNTSATICSGTNVTFTATPINGGTAPVYQWKKNGVNVGTNSPTYSNAALANNDQIKCVMTSNLAGVAGNPATSNTIIMQVNPLPTATITSAGPTTFCSGLKPLTLTANSGTGLTYAWRKGTSYVANATASTYLPSTTGSYTVRVTNTNGCTKISNAVAVTVLAAPAATITASGSLTFCAGDSVILQANSGTGYTYQWKSGTANITGATSQNYTAKTAATYKVLVTNPNSCTKLSAGKKVVVNCRTVEGLENNFVSELSVYPNPSNGSFILSLNNEEFADGTAHIQIINSLGQTVYTSNAEFANGELNYKMDAGAAIAKGFYFVRAEINGIIYNSRLVME